MATCPAVGLLLVTVNPYGQEGIYRAVLFGLPWLAIMASVVLAGLRFFDRLALFATTLCLLPAFLISSFGLDADNVIRPSDLAAVRDFEQMGGPRPPFPYTMLLLTPGDQPVSPPAQGGSHFILDWDANFKVGPNVKAVTRRFLRNAPNTSEQANLYALWSPAGANYGRAYALQSYQESARIRDAFRASRFWSVAFQAGRTYLFRFEPTRFRGG
jgi:hypothetical protein